MSKCKSAIEQDIKQSYIKKVLPYINSKDTLVLDSSESGSYLELTNKGVEYPQVVNRLLYTINNKLTLNFGKLNSSKTRIDITIPEEVTQNVYEDYIEFSNYSEELNEVEIVKGDTELSEELRLEQESINLDITEEELYLMNNSNFNVICK